MALAAGLFTIRIHRLRSYAVIEIAFGLATCWDTIARSGNYIDPLKLGTSVYLMIRGLDNMRKDIDERKRRTAASVK